ncbi:MAG: phosphoribosylpyrophosphate synthetase [Prolixibacteraceae bacterium]
MNNQYTTLSEAVELLKKRGYSHNFRVSDRGELIETGEERFDPSKVKLVEFHRFEGTSDPADMSIVYVLETESGIKGTVVDSFGVEGSETISDFMNKVEQGQYED